MTDTRKTVTRVLGEWAEGDASARDRLVPLIYDELRRLAGGFMKREQAGHTLQPTALVNEALIRLYDQRNVPSEGRAQLMGLLAQLMRRVLADHVRRRSASKRGADRERVTLVDDLVAAPSGPVDLLDLDRALDKLAELDPRQVRVVELRVFGGLGVDEVAEILGIARATVKRDWRFAKLWLSRELARDGNT